MPDIFPIIYSCNDAYVPYTYISIKSLRAHKNPLNCYRIYILQTDLSSVNKSNLLSLQEENFTIEFIDVEKIFQHCSKDIFHLNLHFTIETYFRFFLPELIPHEEKVLYLDGDTVIQKDVSGLFSIDLDECYLAASRDMEVIRAIHYFGEEYAAYFTDTLGLSSVDNYFQAGVLLVNLKQWRKENLTQRLLECLRNVQNPMYVDQDILNAVCQNRVKFIAQNWDFTWHLPFLDSRFQEHLPASFVKQYLEAKQHPYIIHFTGASMKPEDKPEEEGAQPFWNYAAATPYFELLWQRMWQKQLEGFKFAHKNKWRLWRYNVLSRITWGRKRLKYIFKYTQLYNRITKFL